MMHGRGKSDEAIVAVKPANKAERSAAELVEPRAGTEGSVCRLSTRRTQRRISVIQGVGLHTAANWCLSKRRQWQKVPLHTGCLQNTDERLRRSGLELD